MINGTKRYGLTRNGPKPGSSVPHVPSAAARPCELGRMYHYILRRLLLLIPTLFLVTLLVFSIIRLLPGNIVVLMMSEQGMLVIGPS